MPATYRTVATGTAASGNVSVTKPSGTVDGDLLLAVHYQDPDGAPASQTASGWTQVGSTQDNGNGSTKLWRKAASGEGASYTFGGDGSASSVVIVIRIDGHNAGSPIDVTGTFGTGSTSTSHVSPSVSPAGSDSLLVCGAYGLVAGAQTVTYTAPGSMTERADLQPPGTWIVGTLATEALAASGATGTRTFNSSASKPWNAFAVAIASAAGGTDATAQPAVLATSTALARPDVSTAAGPAALATAAAPARPDVHVAAGPAVLAAVTALNRPDINVVAGPAVLLAPYALPQATPAVGGDGTATPATVATVASLPAAAVNVTVGTTVVPTVVTLARPDINTTAGPAALATTTALPQVAVNVTVGATVIPTAVSIPVPGAGGSTTATPDAITVTLTIPQSAVNVAAGPATVATVVTIPLVSLPGLVVKALSDPTVSAAVASAAAVSALRTSVPGAAHLAGSAPTVG